MQNVWKFTRHGTNSTLLRISNYNLHFEGSHPDLLHNTVADNDAPAYQVWLQNVQHLIRHHPDMYDEQNDDGNPYPHPTPQLLWRGVISKKKQQQKTHWEYFPCCWSHWLGNPGPAELSQFICRKSRGKFSFTDTSTDETEESFKANFVLTTINTDNHSRSLSLQFTKLLFTNC